MNKFDLILYQRKFKSMSLTNSEKETIRARVTLLSIYFPEYKDDLKNALNYSISDPASSLMKCRQILEHLFTKIWKKLHSSEKSPSLSEVIITGNRF